MIEGHSDTIGFWLAYDTLLVHLHKCFSYWLIYQGVEMKRNLDILTGLSSAMQPNGSGISSRFIQCF